MTDFVDQGVEVILRADKTYRWQGHPNTPFKIELRDNNDVVVASLDRTGKIISPSIPTVDTAGEGYFFGLLVTAAVPTVSGAFAAAANRVHAWQFVLSFRTIIRNITWELITGVNSSLSAAGIYNADGSSLLIDSGAVGTAIADQGQQQTSITAVTLEPGVYFYVTTSTSASVIGRAWSVGTSTWGPTLNEGSIKKIGFGNVSSSGVLPAALGTITANTSVNPIICAFEP